MAKLTRTIDVRLGDVVDFMVGGKVITGTVQCVTEFPDIFVETGNPSKKYPGYKRYRISVNEIVEVHFKEGEFIDEVIQFDDGEPLEFVYGDDMVTRKVTSRNGSPKGVVKLIRGSGEKSEYVWKFLKNMGASNTKGFNFDGEDMYYYIDAFGEVDYLEKVDALKLLNEGKCELFELPNDAKESPESDVRSDGKTMITIDAACEWVSEHCYDYLSCDGPMESYYIRKNDFVSDFRDAMEGKFGNGYRMVDLGLPSGLKWADRNVGAATPESFGDHFAWGETAPMGDNWSADTPYDWAHAPFNNGSEDFDDGYFNAHKSEWLTDEGVLKLEYDAAHVNMGGSWRMPTSAEIRELIGGTTQSVEELNGIAGMRFTSKANGNSVFMPFAGRRNGSFIDSVGNSGYAWSSSLDSDYVSCSHLLGVYNSGHADVYDYNRYYGFVVRGVHE